MWTTSRLVNFTGNIITFCMILKRDSCTAELKDLTCRIINNEEKLKHD